jgi:hypothetical protein
MNPSVPIALLGWPIAALALFALLPARRAVLVTFIAGWLLLPHAGFGLPGLPDYTKVTAVSLAALLGMVLFDAGRLLRVRPSWIDLPMAAWCAVPFLSSLSNGLGAYDGLSGVLDHVMTWGVPYIAGRAYLDGPEALRELALGLVIGGLCYLPLCLWEVRMSPQLHRSVYGFHPTHFMMTWRLGGYRPMVFMQHGLMLGLFMSCSALAAIWLWRRGAVRHLFGVPMSLLAAALAATALLCKSAGALALMFGGLVLLTATRLLRLDLLVIGAALAAPTYAALRISGTWDGRHLVDAARAIDADRAASLSGRLRNEVLIAERAMERPLLGWGRWGRWRVRDDAGRDITVSDGLWVIALGQSGLIGLGALSACLALPVLLLLRRVPARTWGQAAAAPAAVLGIIVVLYTLDGLLNAMLNPIYVLAAGGLSSLYACSGLAVAPLRLAWRRSRAGAVAEASAP